MPFRFSFAFPRPGVELLRKFLRLYFRIFHFTVFRGRENLPAEGSYIIAPNHQSYYDPIMVAAAQDHYPLRFMTWDIYFSRPIFGKLISDWGAFPVDLEGKDPGGFRRCIKLLKEGEHVVIFPEGGRTFDGKLRPMRDGTARLAMRARVPIIPVRIAGAINAWPRADMAPRPFFKIDFEFLPPIYPKEARPGEERRREADRIMQELRKAIDPTVEG